jgi:hypothetical protein
MLVAMLLTATKLDLPIENVAHLGVPAGNH